MNAAIMRLERLCGWNDMNAAFTPYAIASWEWSLTCDDSPATAVTRGAHIPRGNAAGPRLRRGQAGGPSGDAGVDRFYLRVNAFPGDRGGS
jgi:hypothetical protein